MAQPVARSTLDFFDAQARARRKTAVLVASFLLAWFATIALADLGLAVVVGIDPATLLLPVAAIVSLVVLLGSTFHALRLAAGGGDAVARMLGGRPVDRQTSDPAEKRLVNVLEEMSIAAGLPVPRLYVLEREEGINAFAAGFTPDRSVVAVTRGALRSLDRDELQGVVAHELSHILNADTRLSTRLMALVGGLTVLALVGRILLRAEGGRDGGRGRAAAVGAGLCFVVAGSVGAFFGRLIRLAVSRQRELLADAAAVQFTRNPDGLARALLRIAAQGSKISNAHAVEASHLFFADGVGDFLSGLFATHPPIEERIRRLAPHGLGPAPAAEGAAPAPAAATAAGAVGAAPVALAAAAVASVGHPSREHVERAADQLAALPPAAVAAAREPFGARALCLGLLLDREPEVRSRQLGRLADPSTAAAVAGLLGAADAVKARDRMALLDLALPALDHLSPAQASALAADMASIAQAGTRHTVFEWAAQRVVRRRLEPLLGGRPAAPVRSRTVGDVEVECLEILSSLAWAGERDPARAQRALEAGLRALGVAAPWRLLPIGKIDAGRLDHALARLDEASPPLKARVLAACVACALADGRVTAAEGEIVRAVAASLGCPVPPLPEGGLA
ncbi:MAG TPA: M48 family metallopeptidase [Anaeromyxobacteraceae bacterium]|nr:M48 family metallopeptidase [Anaeromyxobacteraceae bacterium]